MALVNFTAALEALHGLFDGCVYVSHNGQSFIRRFSKPADPDTPLQRQIRDAITYLSQRFSELTPVNVAQWEAFAPTYTVTRPNGSTRPFTALEAFIAYNFYMYLGDNSFNGVPGAFTDGFQMPTAPPNLLYNTGTGILSVAFDPFTFTPPDGFWCFRVTPPTATPARKGLPSQLRHPCASWEDSRENVSYFEASDPLPLTLIPQLKTAFDAATVSECGIEVRGLTQNLVYTQHSIFWDRVTFIKL